MLFWNTKGIYKIQTPAMVMVWAAITADGRSPLVFIDRGVKINAKYDRKNILEALANFGHSIRTKHHSHSVRSSHEWLKNEVPRLISTAQ